MRNIAIVGSGPAGYYTAEAALKQWGSEVHIDIFDAQPVPFGLIRSGVAPDHQSIKAVSQRYETTALSNNVRFVGNIMLGRDISVPELQSLYDVVILATGAPKDRALNIPGDTLGNVFQSAAFVGWYNGHPQFSNLAPDLSQETAVIIGNGNVALDVARILAKSEVEFLHSDIVSHALEVLKNAKIRRIVILGRRGPQHLAMSAKELGELANLERAHPEVKAAQLPPKTESTTHSIGLRKSLEKLRKFTESNVTPEKNAITITFEFFAAPRAIIGSKGHVKAIEVERTTVENDKAIGTGEIFTIPTGIVISCIGYQTSPIPDVPFDEQGGRFANIEGRISPGLYCVGWARRGPTGTIGSNRPDGFSIVEKIAHDQPESGNKAGRTGLDALITERNLEVVKFTDWQKINDAEVAAARTGAPREKFTAVEKMIETAAKS